MVKQYVGSQEHFEDELNGSYNIMKKAIPNVFSDGIEGLGVIPNIVKILK